MVVRLELAAKDGNKISSIKRQTREADPRRKM